MELYIEIWVLLLATFGALGTAGAIYSWGKHSGIKKAKNDIKLQLEIDHDTSEVFDEENGYLGHFDKDHITDYLRSHDVKEMWLSGAALLHCIKDVSEGAAQYFGKEDGDRHIILKFILTDIRSDLALESYTNLFKAGKENKCDVHHKLIDAYRGIFDLLDKLETLKFKVNVEIYLNAYPMKERIWIMNPHDTNGTTFIKTYPDKNANCNGIYEGGFQFKLRNNTNYSGYKFFYDKFQNYRIQSGEHRTEKYIRNLLSHECKEDLIHFKEFK